MTGWSGLDLTGGPAESDPADETDALLDRLGRREPGPADLDDAVAASLALLAGDVDLRPVPLDVTHRALIAAGAWPLPEVWSDPPGAAARPEIQPGSLPAGPLHPGAEGPADRSAGAWADSPFAPDPGGAASAAAPVESRPDAAPIVCPRTPPEGRIRPDGERPARGRRAADRRAGDRRRSDRRAAERRGTGPGPAGARRGSGLTEERRPQVLMMRSSLGLVAAAALVVLGGGMSAVVTGGDTMNPLTGLTSVVQHWGESAGHSTPRELQAKVEAARSLLQDGHPTDAAAIIDDVKADIAALDGDDRRRLDAEITVLEGQLLDSAGGSEPGVTSSGEEGTNSSGSVGSAGDDASDPLLEPRSGDSRSGESRSGEPRSTAGSTTSRSAGSVATDDTSDGAVVPASSTHHPHPPRSTSGAGPGGGTDPRDPDGQPGGTTSTEPVAPLSAGSATTDTSTGAAPSTSVAGPTPPSSAPSGEVPPPRPKVKPQQAPGKGNGNGRGNGNNSSGGQVRPRVAPAPPPASSAAADQAGPPTTLDDAPSTTSAQSSAASADPADAGAPPGAQ